MNFFDRLLGPDPLQVLVPGGILICLMTFISIIAFLAQKRQDFDWGDAFRDQTNKVSSIRVFAFVCLAISSWIIAVLTMNGKLTYDFYLAYLLTWSGSMVLVKVVDTVGQVMGTKTPGGGS